jgi:hypothetical protein
MRVTDAARAVLGTTLLVRPDVPVRLLGGAPTATSDTVVRVLGARWLLQAGLGMVVASRRAGTRRRAGAADAVVEGLHAASMIALAATSPRWARPAAVNAAVAVVFAVADLRARPARPAGLRRPAGSP